jgi:hypothetical protein
MPRTRHQEAAAAAAEEAEARATRTDAARHSVLLNSTDLLREVLGCLSAQTPLCLVGCENVCTTWAASARSLYTSQEMASTWVRISMSSLFSVELLLRSAALNRWVMDFACVRHLGSYAGQGMWEPHWGRWQRQYQQVATAKLKHRAYATGMPLNVAGPSDADSESWDSEEQRPHEEYRICFELRARDEDIAPLARPVAAAWATFPDELDSDDDDDDDDDMATVRWSGGPNDHRSPDAFGRPAQPTSSREIAQRGFNRLHQWIAVEDRAHELELNIFVLRRTDGKIFQLATDLSCGYTNYLGRETGESYWGEEPWVHDGDEAKCPIALWFTYFDADDGEDSAHVQHFVARMRVELNAIATQFEGHGYGDPVISSFELKFDLEEDEEDEDGPEIVATASSLYELIELHTVDHLWT